jgi:hypothetical protein
MAQTFIQWPKMKKREACLQINFFQGLISSKKNLLLLNNKLTTYYFNKFKPSMMPVVSATWEDHLSPSLRRAWATQQDPSLRKKKI